MTCTCQRDTGEGVGLRMNCGVRDDLGEEQRGCVEG